MRHFQVSHGLAAPDRVAVPKLSLVERGIRRAKSVEHKSVCLPITPAILRQLRVLWSMNVASFDYIMLCAACCVAFFGFFRMGEIMSSSICSYDTSRQLTMADVAVDDGQNPTVENSLEVHKNYSILRSSCFSGKNRR